MGQKRSSHKAAGAKDLGFREMAFWLAGGAACGGLAYWQHADAAQNRRRAAHVEGATSTTPAQLPELLADRPSAYVELCGTALVDEPIECIDPDTQRGTAVAYYATEWSNLMYECRFEAGKQKGQGRGRGHERGHEQRQRQGQGGAPAPAPAPGGDNSRNSRNNNNAGSLGKIVCDETWTHDYGKSYERVARSAGQGGTALSDFKLASRGMARVVSLDGAGREDRSRSPSGGGGGGDNGGDGAAVSVEGLRLVDLRGVARRGESTTTPEGSRIALNTLKNQHKMLVTQVCGSVGGSVCVVAAAVLACVCVCVWEVCGSV